MPSGKKREQDSQGRKIVDAKDVKVKKGVAEPPVGRARPVLKAVGKAAGAVRDGAKVTSKGVARPIIKMGQAATQKNPSGGVGARKARPVLQTTASSMKATAKKNPSSGVGARKVKVNDKREKPQTVTNRWGEQVTMPTRKERGASSFVVPKGAKLSSNVRVKPRKGKK